tara:strand:- start:12 stop:734 length:723 start_codon:yes stop_codon:yes gene_type:complete
MSYFKKLRKSLKSTYFFNIIQNYFHNPIKTYSDCFGEDLFVNNYFSGVRKGFYLDIGCNQPKINSLTYSLHKKGWKGLNCDISERCIKLYKFFRKDDVNLNIAVGPVEKKVNSFIFYENCTMNTVDEDFKKHTFKSVNKEPEIRVIEQKTLNQILIENNVKVIDYLNIDVEGYEINVLKGFSIKKYSPKLISIEIHDTQCPPEKNQIYQYFMRNNYTLVSIYGWTYFFEYKKNSKVHFRI